MICLMPPAYSIRCRRYCCRFGKCCIASVPSVIVKSPSGNFPQGARYWAALGMPLWETMLSRLMFAYPSCPARPVPHGIPNTPSKGSVHGRYNGAAKPPVCPYGYTNGGFLAIEQTVNPVFKFDALPRPTTAAIQEYSKGDGNMLS